MNKVSYDIPIKRIATEFLPFTREGVPNISHRRVAITITKGDISNQFNPKIGSNRISSNRIRIFDANENAHDTNNKGYEIRSLKND